MAMPISISTDSIKKRAPSVVAWVVFAIVAISGLWWFPKLRDQIQNDPSADATADGAETEDEHEDHAGNSTQTSLDLSEQALRNVGYQPLTVALGPYIKTIGVPAQVVERPGQSLLNVPAPMTGIVTKVYAIEGEAVEPGSPLFELRLTHEELVSAQREYLQKAVELSVLLQEISRLEAITDGVIARKRVLELKYEQQKAEASLLAHRQGLKLHGLSDVQIDDIRKSQQLIQTLTVYAPQEFEPCESLSGNYVRQVQDLTVTPGQQIQTGESLCKLADHCLLYLEGKAFEADVNLLTNVTANDWPISASLSTGGNQEILATGLKIYRLGNKVEAESRAFHFYLLLPNQVIRDEMQGDKRFVSWRFKPGQRMQIDIPIARDENKIVLPASAVVSEGPEAFVFQQNGARFDRVSVHIEERDNKQVVIANDGSLFPGDTIAGVGAYQMHLAIKNKSGGAPDPHAGHNH